MNSKIYKWFICGAGTLALFCTGGLLVTGFNVYTPYLISEGGLTNAQVSLILMVRNLFTLIAMFLVVPMIRKLDVRLGMTAAVLVAAAAFLVLSAAGNFPMYVAGMSLSGLSYGLGGMVTVSVIIRRWFAEHDGLPLGICTAGTGLSSVIGSPVITWMVEKFSMRFAFRMEAIFMAAVAALLFLLIRNYPSLEKEHEVEEIRRAKLADKKHHEVFAITHGEWMLLVLGVLFCGMSYNVSPYLSVLFRERSFDAAAVGWLLCFMGVALMVGKIVYGEAVDVLGRVRAGNVFHGCFVAAILICTLCLPGNSVMACFAMALLGLGFPMLSVGLSELAGGLAHPEYYADAVKQLQIIYMIGSLVFGPVPGLMADRFGSYTPVYVVLVVISLLSAVLQQFILAKHSK